MTDINAAYRATFTRRWHSNPDMADQNDEVGAHQGRVALLALCLWPTAHAVHRAAILHDLGEAAVGDMNGEAKRRDPGLASCLARLEADAMTAMALPKVALMDGEQRMLKLADKLDAYLFVRHRRPHLLAHPDWAVAKADIMSMAWQTSVGPQVMEILG